MSIGEVDLLIIEEGIGQEASTSTQLPSTTDTQTANTRPTTTAARSPSSPASVASTVPAKTTPNKAAARREALNAEEVARLQTEYRE